MPVFIRLFKFIRKYPILSGFLSALSLFFFVPGLLTVASTFLNIIGVIITVASLVTLAILFFTMFFYQAQSDTDNPFDDTDIDKV